MSETKEKVTSFKRKGYYAEIWKECPYDTPTNFEVRIIYDKTVVTTFEVKTRALAKTSANKFIDNCIRTKKDYRKEVLQNLHDWLSI